eukprot:scaffold87029_cov26-Tisochrysis_lutea.AAC.2
MHMGRSPRMPTWRLQRQWATQCVFPWKWPRHLPWQWGGSRSAFPDHPQIRACHLSSWRGQALRVVAPRAHVPARKRPWRRRPAPRSPSALPR